MALYEVVLRYPDRDEVRLTDAPLSTSSTVEIAGETWTVTLDREPTTDMAATPRFLCELTTSQRERAERLQAFNRDMRARMLAQRSAPCSPGGTA
jgi:hypothetical protein